MVTRVIRSARVVAQGLVRHHAMTVRLRFGLEGGGSRTLEGVGREFQVTRERIRQIESRAIGKLRHSARSRELMEGRH